MDSLDPRDAVGKLVKVLRKITRVVQIVPFVYLVFYCLYLALTLIASDETLCHMDNILYVSPVTSVGLLFASRLLNLCVWHRTACLLPFTGKIETYIDNHLFQFTQDELSLINFCLMLAVLAFLCLTYKRFLYGR